MDRLAQPVAALAEAAGDLLVRVDGDPATPVSGVAYDSRAVRAGDLFFCVVGERSDGHGFAAAAVEAGAVALCVERPTGTGVPEIVVSDVRAAMPLIAARSFGDPAAELLLLGITGTNGKTTTAFLVESILTAAGKNAGLIGTIETHIAGDVRPGVRTTPESIDLQALFAEMRDSGVDAVAMEVTSHALVLNRVDGVRFSSVVFTNLTQDHLDFHPTMEDYLAAKQSLFQTERAERGAVNLDDEFGAQIAARSAIPVIGFGTSAEAEVRAVDVEFGAAGSRFRLITPQGETMVSTPLAGPFNVSNCLAAASLVLLAGIPLESIPRGIAALKAVPGRFESIDRGQPFSVIVDYAHTPEALNNVLVAARRVAQTRGGRVVCVFGAGGDRDRGKRPLMGMAVARGADVVIVTSDNPRSEVPEAIIGQIAEGVNAERPEGPDAALVDRRAAIFQAVSGAEPGDVVVVAGKGHETGQQFATETIPFDDRLVVAEALAARGWGEPA
jgi:UDP-N-acetylmuramoyl-L-alanyl-D-glutamate--2,6-diaminopimelate ligase